MTNIQGALIDLDGTVYRGNQLIPNANDGILALKSAGVELVFLSNNATKRPIEYREKLGTLGVDVPTDRVLNSAAISADYLATNHSGAGVFVLGESSLKAELVEADLDVVDDPSCTDIVLVSMYFDFDYDDLQHVLDADRAGGTLLYATNPDRTCPVEGGEVPDAGAIIGAVEGLLGREIDRVLGKPSQVTIDVALDRIGLEPDECVMIGDRLETDIRMGQIAGMETALVCSGVTKRADLAGADIEPDHVLDSLADAGDILE